MKATSASSKSSPKSKAAKAKPGASGAVSASERIDERIRELGGWRGETLARMRALILEADPEITEEWKWETPVWSRGGILCTGEAYKSTVKLTFAKGAALADPSGLFNSSLEGNTRRAIDLKEGEKVNVTAFKKLVIAAVAQNAEPVSKTKPAPKAKAVSEAKKPASPSKPAAPKEKPVKLLSGGNPQIAKGEGDAPVQAYIAALSGWKAEVCRWLDALIVKNVPNAKKAVKWNSPFYGIEGQGWFISFHVFTRYVKVTFFKGSSLKPVPPGTSKDPDVRYLDIHEEDERDDAQLSKWLKQAAALPGWIP